MTRVKCDHIIKPLIGDAFWTTQACPRSVKDKGGPRITPVAECATCEFNRRRKEARHG